jgi:hypothetical protein
MAGDDFVRPSFKNMLATEAGFLGVAQLARTS